MSYRRRPRNELEIRGEPSTTIVVWAIWIMTAVLFVAAVTVDDVHRLRRVSIAIGGAVLSVAGAFYLAARRVRWRFTLDDFRLHIERRSRASTDNVTLDVRAGVCLGLGMAEGAGRVDQCIVLLAGPTRTTVTTGTRPVATLDRLIQFLREHDVAVTELPDSPVGWSGGGGGQAAF